MTPGEFGVGLPTLRDDEHHSPITMSEDSLERLNVNMAGLRRISGMRVDPDACKLFGTVATVDLIVKEVRDSEVFECDGHFGAVLFDEDEVIDEQQVFCFGHSKPTDFRRPSVTQV